MNCNNCGGQYQDDMNFCPYCGTPKATEQYNQPDYQQPPYNANQYGYQQPYNQPYNQQYNQPYGNNYMGENPNDKPSALLNLLAFFFPIVGLILYLIWKDQYPKKAKKIGKWALVSVIIGVVFYIIFMILWFTIFFTAGMSSFSYMTSI